MISLKDKLNDSKFKLSKEQVDHELKGKLVELLNNLEYKDKLSSLHMPNELLTKYVYDLEESLIECNNCSKCKNLISCKNKINGFYYNVKRLDDNLQFSYDMCKYLSEIKNRENKNMYVLDVPEAIKTASMSDIYLNDVKRIDAIKEIKQFITNYNKDNTKKGIYLHGNFGGGKTYLLAAMFNELSKKNIRSAVVYYPELLRNLKNFQEDFESKFNYLKKVPLLLLDDIGAENVTPWNRDEILGPILQYRMESYLPTFFTSNLNIKELEEHFSITNNNQDKVKARRIIERILVVSNVIEMISENKRN